MDDQRTDRESSRVLIEKWCEVWIDMGLNPPYLLLVLPSENGGVVVRDPTAGIIAHEGPDYESVKLWLLEDEFMRVEGRMTGEEI